MSKPFLTIGMIVKNEEAVLRRCLDSLVPLMEAIPSELLITDTGSTDRTVEIAKEYTDKISYFQWNNDFSAARNVALSQAKGTWFMMFDADGWFGDVSPLVEFFQSEEHKKYKSASVTSRNYIDVNDRGKYTDTRFGIFYKMFKGIHFSGKIHESIPVEMPTHKFLPVICHHTGYDFTDDIEKKKKKHERNLQPLMAEYKENPEHLRTLDHLIKQYKGIGEIVKAKEYVEKAYDLVKGKPEDLYFSLIYKHLCALREAETRWQEALHFAEEYLENRKQVDAIDLDFHIIIARSCMNMDRANGAIESFNKYLSLYEDYEKGILTDEISLIDKVENGTPYYRLWAKVNLANCYLFNGEENNFIDTISRIEVGSLSLDHLETLIGKPLQFGKEKSDFTLLADLLERILKTIVHKADEKVGRSIQIIENYLLGEPDIFESLSEALAGLDFEHIYLKLMKLRAADTSGRTESTKKILKDLIPEDINQGLYLGDLIFYAFKYGDDVSELLARVDENNLGAIASNTATLHRELFGLLNHRIESTEQREMNLKEQLYIGLLLEQLLIRADSLKGKDAILCFNRYAEWMKYLLSTIYNLDFLNTEMAKIIPPGFRFAFYVTEALAASAEGDKLKFIQLLKAGIQCYPPMKSIIGIVLDNFEKQEKKAPTNEFEEYAAMVKAKIIELLEMGMRTEVIPLIDAYEKVNPQDPDLHQLKNRAGLLN